MNAGLWGAAMLFVASLFAVALVGQPGTPAATEEAAPVCWFGDAYAAAGGEACQASGEETPEPTATPPEVAVASPARNGCERTEGERRNPVTGQIERSVDVSCVGGSDDPRAREELERLRRDLTSNH